MKARENKSSKKLFILIAVVVALIAGIGFFIFNKMNAAGKQEKVPVLQYYYLTKDNDKNQNPVLKDKTTAVSVGMFEKQMKYLADNQYHTLTLEEFNQFIKNKKKLPKKSVLITFDNTSKSNYVYAYPILKKYKMHATSFAVTSRISNKEEKFNPKTFQMLSMNEMDKMKDVFEFGSHTHTLHKFKNGSAAILVEGNQIVKNDILKSKDVLKSNYMSYPFGKYNKDTLQILKDLKMELAFTSLQGYATPENNPLEIKRWFISADTKMDNFEKIVSGEYEVPNK
ncbi:transcriptional regulator [Bacillus wiedmannii]|jgi:peptidoglycan/xylan/chitin deacetylase (PgdA/CDA1 family)|uniref:polysaccharide deacetylase family protein n=1 Tax=Bacillus cereus group TaxID=86661 RepID=UPI0008567520|nr:MULTISPECIES: polysaccharide deacetylase family protein [Bacillus cereus group]PEC62654.1 transcriptional regulator [Bacillus wiedmannii]PEI39122.1 transcriptional regulator [Bacillus wiedmannii]PEL42431.1 transcriptional regulator [Bacillus wiedmannii]PEN97287.1 transcriptional regulator [Bacillus wiedmannii]PHE06738.1 transcriptional regulator [Bacillus wiedmannii]